MGFQDPGGSGTAFGGTGGTSAAGTATPTGPPPAAPTPSGGGGGGGGPAPPNYAGIIAGNPYYLAAQALALQQLAALKAQTGAAAARAAINLGDYSVIRGFKGLDIPSNTGALVDQANQSGTSLLAQLLHAHSQNAEQIPAVLAGRGFYRSGETGHQLGEETRQYGIKQETGRSQTLDYLNNLYSNYVNAQFGIQQNTLNAYLTAYQQALGSLGAYGYGGGGGGGGGAPATDVPSPGPSSYIDYAQGLFKQPGSSFLGGTTSSGF